jgi:hypothetical protein
MSQALEQLRRQLAVVIEEAARSAELQRQAAEAIEHATSSAAVRAAYEQGRRDERHRAQTLIKEHHSMLKGCGVNAISLSAIAKLLQEA